MARKNNSFSLAMEEAEAQVEEAQQQELQQETAVAQTEEAQEVALVAEGDGMEIDPETPVFGSVEFVEEEQGFDDYVEDHEDAVESVAALESLYDTVLNSHDNGGLSLTAAAVALESLSRIRQKSGFSDYVINGTGFESFDKASGRRANTDLALESISESITALWAGMVAGLAKIGKNLGTFVDGVMMIVRKNKTTISAFHKRLANAKKQSTDAKFTNQANLQGLTIGGKFSPAKSFASVTSVLAKAGTDSLGEFSGIISTLKSMGEIKESMKAGNLPTFHNLDAGKLLPFAVSKGSSDSALLEKFTSSQEFPGGVEFTAEVPKKTTPHQEIKLGLKGAYLEEAKEKDVAVGEQDFLDAKALATFLGELENVNDKLQAFEVKLSKIVKEFQQVVSTISTKGKSIIGTIGHVYWGGVKGQFKGAVAGGVAGAVAGGVASGGNPLGAVVGAGLGANIGGGIGGVKGYVDGYKASNTKHRAKNPEFFDTLGAIVSAVNKLIVPLMKEVTHLSEMTIISGMFMANQNLKALGA